MAQQAVLRWPGETAILNIEHRYRTSNIEFEDEDENEDEKEGKRSTSNVQHPTSNIEQPTTSIRKTLVKAG
jgi:hypothetical protein